ncbi:DUF3889 domain-containing protein [Ammoniphilus sp. YIM 78166]|uniref:DUF3889 domain-containing protein n=1 Tax=Ammoniphilus sp. YIM 78166 TaxID=1644106 RepID=UPI00106F15B2|nr:DUF3889 domain-containing protein [Ammoniphilus sp. YIM 78166]
MDRKKTILLITLFFLLTSTVVHAQQQSIAYAKWGRLAMQETQKKYPQAEIIDYLYVGLKTLTPTTGQQTFKLWLRQGNKEFGVYVRIKFDLRSEEVHSISFEETTS